MFSPETWRSEVDGMAEQNDELRRLRREKEDLLEENQQLRRENGALVKEQTSLRERVSFLESLVERLEARLAILEKTTGSGKGDAPKHPKGGSGKCKRGSKRRGRPPGHPGTSFQVPGPVDEVRELGLDGCPHCEGDLTEWRDHQDHIVVDIEIRRVVRNFRHERGYCPHCRQTVRAPCAPDEPPRGHLGLGVLALIAELKTQAGVPYGKLSKLLRSWEIPISTGGLSGCMQRMAEWLTATYDQLKTRVRDAAVTHADETSWPVDGRLWWTWMFEGRTDGEPPATVYVTEPTRSAEVPKAVLGEDYGGVLTSDFYAAYDGIGYERQTCWAHLLREAKSIAASGHADAVRLCRTLGRLYQDAKIIDDAREMLTSDQLHAEIRKLEQRVHRLCRERSSHSDTARIQKRLQKYFATLFVFLQDPNVEPTNNAGERAIRPFVVARKMSGGSRSPEGARGHAVIFSCFRSLVNDGRSFADLLMGTMTDVSDRKSLASVLES